MNTETEPTRVIIPTAKLRGFIKKAYELSQPQGMGHLHFQPGELADDEVEYILNRESGRGIGMDYVKGRAVKLHIEKVGDQYSVLHFAERKWFDHTNEQFLELLKAAE